MENVEVCYEQGLERRKSSWLFMDIKDYLASYCTQFSENLEGVETSVVENGIVIKLWNDRKEIKIMLDNDAARKLIDGAKRAKM
ncbi:MAG: hypothetical protein R6U44_07745 [Archaeoglobaceae archaeon]